jgi:hypothetical protein
MELAYLEAGWPLVHTFEVIVLSFAHDFSKKWAEVEKMAVM